MACATNSKCSGCTDSTACNYDASATDDDGSCTYADEFYDCDGNCLNDTDGDGVCDELLSQDARMPRHATTTPVQRMTTGLAPTPMRLLDCDGNCLNDNTSTQTAMAVRTEIDGCTDPASMQLRPSCARTTTDLATACYG